MKKWTKNLIQQLIVAVMQALTYFLGEKDKKEVVAQAVKKFQGRKGEVKKQSAKGKAIAFHKTDDDLIDFV